jgi:hypothetical protein
MSADWFCKIGDKRVGPLSGQQLKSIVAQGQLRPDHLVRRGSEGPWVPAGRIKGLFPDGAATGDQTPAKKLPQATARPLPEAAKPIAPPIAKATNLPTAAEAAAPPVADMPQELTLGGHHKHHVEMNVENLNLQVAPVDVSRRKVKAGLHGMKKDERKKLTIFLMCLIGIGTTVGLVVFIWAVATDQFAGSRREEAKESAALPQAAASAKKPEKAVAETKPAPEKEPDSWPRVSMKIPLGKVEVMVLKPNLGAPPKGAKATQAEVLTVPVRLNLKAGETKPIELASWMDDNLKPKVSLMDDQKNSYALLDQVADKNSDGKTISEKWLKVHLVFEAPTNKNLKSLHLKLPASAFHADGPMVYCEIVPSDIRIASDAAKAAKPDESEPGDDASKGEKN